MLIQKGQVLNDRYRIVSLLGKGGFGAVYRAWDLNMEAPCAVKENLAVTAASARQFKREAKLLNKLRHPNLPRVTDHFVINRQGQYLVMDYIEGEDLQSMLGRMVMLPEPDVLEWIAQVCDALHYLHSQEPPIIHRDIKPANIRITPENNAILVDFGIAKIFDISENTTLGAKAVTPGYSPPEQYGHGKTDSRADIYALGATLYTLLTGTQPSDSVDIATGIKPPPEPANKLNPSISQNTSSSIIRATQTERARRYQSIKEFEKELTQKRATGQASSLPYQHPAPIERIPPKQKKKARPNRLILMVSISLGLLILICASTFWVYQNFFASPSSAQFSHTETSAVEMVENVTYTQPPPTAFASEEMLVELATMTPTYEALETITLAPTPTEPEIVQDIDLPSPIYDSHLMEMILVPAGTFWMGSEAGYENERPVHEVYLEAYYIDKYEVTKAILTTFLNEIGTTESDGEAWIVNDEALTRIQKQDGKWKPQSGYYGHPASGVTWFGAKAFCEWRGARLPTEAEWEKAARGPDSLVYPWGINIDCSKANYLGCTGDTASVVNYPAGESPYGVQGMSGNVWEWVKDWYASEYYSDSPYENPEGPINGNARVLRGGSFASEAIFLRGANRFRRNPDVSNQYIGIRCARPAEFNLENTQTEPKVQLSNFNSCDRPCNDPNALIVEEYPEKTGEVFVRFDYQGMKKGIPYTRTWSVNGAEWIRYDCFWEGPENGEFNFKLWETMGLRSGEWDVNIFVNGKLALEDSVKIAGSYSYWDPAGTLPCADW